MHRLIFVTSLVSTLVLWGSHPVVAQTKPEKAAAAHERALSAFSSGNLDEAASESVMATTLDPIALYFFTAARFYFARDELDLTALYVQKASTSPGREERAAVDAKKKLLIAVEKREESILERISQSCPPDVKRDDLVALRAVVPASGARLLDAFDAQRTCFLAEFPELPKPVKVVQNDRTSFRREKGVFIVLPGKAEIQSADHPAFEMELSGDAGTQVLFRPRGEPWMQAKVSLKGTPPRAEIFLDGETVDASADALVVTPKDKHRLVVSAPGRQRFKSDRFSLPFEGTTTIEVRSHKKRSWVPWVLMGVGAIGAGLGGYFMYDGSATASDFESGLEKDGQGFVTNVGRGNAMSSQDSANASWNGGLGAVIAGGTIIVSGVLWMILEDTTPPEWRN